MSERLPLSLPRKPPRKPMKKSRIKRSNPKRRAKEFARAYHSGERVLFVKGLACVGCGRSQNAYVHIENAHIEGGGASRKADYDKIIPLCGRLSQPFSCHARLHRHGREDLELWGGINLDDEAAKTEARWQEFQEKGE